MSIDPNEGTDGAADGLSYDFSGTCLEDRRIFNIRRAFGSCATTWLLAATGGVGFRGKLRFDFWLQRGVEDWGRRQQLLQLFRSAMLQSEYR
jgi:hypothetical protein